MLIIALAAIAGCTDLGSAPRTLVTGRLCVGPGVVFIERGPIYEGTFERAASIGEDGRFEVELHSSGPHGFHAYVDGYIYLPIAIDVEVGVTNRITQSQVDWNRLCPGGACDWVPQPADPEVLCPGADDDLSNNPIVTNLGVVRVGAGSVRATVDVTDPEGDLSNQILLHHVQSGTGIALNPSRPVIDGNFPNGTYGPQLIGIPGDSAPGGEWQLVAADHTCSSSAIARVTETSD